MYAIIATGGKQYKVSEGDIIDIEKIEGARMAQRSLLTRSSASAETP